MLCAIFVVSPLHAAEPSPDAASVIPSSAARSNPATDTRRTWAYDLATELMSPFCPGRTLASCPSPQAAELIQWIATQEAAGVGREEVVAMLTQRYGEEILGAPPARGITLWAYVFPVLGFLAFGAIAVVVLRRIVAPSAGVAKAPASGTAQSKTAEPLPSAVADPAADELARIVDAELAERA
jgi:cytochrome c-type biogenesis protein CcmH/NrfF